MGTDRHKKPYIDGVAAFLDYDVRNLKISMNMDPLDSKIKIKIPCPCINCVNHISLHVSEVDHHLFRYGIDQNYTKWIKHGEKEDQPRNVSFKENYSMNTTYFDESTSFTIGIPTDAEDTVEMVEATEETFIGDHVKFQKLIEDAEKPLYKGCPNFTKLSAVVQLLNLKSKYGVSDKCFTETLVLIKKMLPEGNEMLSSTYD